jgi:DNA-binding MarR family transcriptional regulator
MIASFDDVIDMSNEWSVVNIPGDKPERLPVLPTDGRSDGRKSPTRDELQAWRSFTETTDLVKRTLEAELQRTSGTSSGDYAVLLALSEQPDHRMRSSPLAEQVGWERSRLSHHLGRMERRALISRERAGDDSRSAWVALTDEGARSFRRASSPHLHSVQRVFVSALTAEQLAALDDAMQALRSHLEGGAIVQPDESSTHRISTDDTPADSRNVL